VGKDGLKITSGADKISLQGPMSGADKKRGNNNYNLKSLPDNSTLKKSENN
jgi:hypothetical protein